MTFAGALPAAWGDAAALGGIVALGVAYAFGVRSLWARAGVGRGLPVAKALAFYLGLGALLAAIASPLDELGHVLFSVHMVQHVVLVLAVAPLLVYGCPAFVLLWALPPGRRRRVGRLWNDLPSLRRAWAALTHPAVTWAAFATVLWVWHVPHLYQWAVLDPVVHALEHATLLGGAYLFWWTVIQPLGRRRLDHGPAILFVFAASVQVTMLGAAIGLAPDPLYPVYAEVAAAQGTTALDDQRVAAIVMRTPMVLVFLGAVAALFLRWMQRMEERASPRARAGT